ncbi:selenide, water dikinase SelD [Pseudomonas sp. Irchel 3E19]|uniref:selenide, water dikinase SelD n=1 Tax=Pseudomonas sp. Irchel 3E19 TaxID=2008981 RepID=UPI000BA4DFCA|nr:selenide, water dikinase SelD [Pseudomonas sp. Irchel 3E19]
MNEKIRLTQYSRSGGCGCKISPQTLEVILSGNISNVPNSGLWVGNESRDDASVFELDADRGVVNSVDFFTPIVDDPFYFGRIAAANAISDIYAMGGEPFVATAILGWPVEKLSPKIAAEVIRGGRYACKEAGITLAGGHSIDSVEPFFGLSVTGIVSRQSLKRNNTAEEGCRIYLSKPLGVGVLSTAEKMGLIRKEDEDKAKELMCILNKAGVQFGKLEGVAAMTDVTGFGLIGHLLEMAEGSGLTARINYLKIPRLDCVKYYIDAGCMPSGARRNYESYRAKVTPVLEGERMLLCDPQTNGGLLVAVKDNADVDFLALAEKEGVDVVLIGEFVRLSDFSVEIV